MQAKMPFAFHCYEAIMLAEKMQKALNQESFLILIRFRKKGAEA